MGMGSLIEWEDYEQELARLCSLSSTLNKAKEKKLFLQQNLQSLIQVRSETLNRSNHLQDLRLKLEGRSFILGNLLMRSKNDAEDLRNRRERLNLQIKTLLLAGKALSLAYHHLEEANRLLAGERGHARLKALHKFLRMRLQYMVAQVSTLYPVKPSSGPIHGENFNSPSPNNNKLDNSAGSKHVSPRSLAISGLELTALPVKKMSFFTDKKEIQRSATALGYIAHVVLLIGSYLDAPLRYPLRMGGSRSYINDYASSVESSSDSSSNPILFTNFKATEFPLFLDGQDTTRAAYAIFLLNKDLEQLLNFIGAQSLGPRHVLANLKELFRTIQSREFND